MKRRMSSAAHSVNEKFANAITRQVVRRVERFSKASFIALSIGTEKRKAKLQKRKAKYQTHFNTELRGAR